LSRIGQRTSSSSVSTFFGAAPSASLFFDVDQLFVVGDVAMSGIVPH
jgi:hypothetical protein